MWNLIRKKKTYNNLLTFINCNYSCRQLQWPSQQPERNKRLQQQIDNYHNLNAVGSLLPQMYLMLQLIFVEHTADSFEWHRLQLHPDFDLRKMLLQHKVQLVIELHTPRLLVEQCKMKQQTELHRQLVSFEIHRVQLQTGIHKGLQLQIVLHRELKTTGLRKRLMQTVLHKVLRLSVQHTQMEQLLAVVVLHMVQRKHLGWNKGLLFYFVLHTEHCFEHHPHRQLFSSLLHMDLLQVV